MAITSSEELEKQGIGAGAAMMALAMRTAPKTRGIDSVRTAVVSGSDIEVLASAMEKKAKDKSTDLPIFMRDANSVRSASALLLVGIKRDPKRMELPFNCGACGFGRCAELVAAGPRQGEDFMGPTCVFQAIDLGIALGSAVKLAQRQASITGSCTQSERRRKTKAFSTRTSSSESPSPLPGRTPFLIGLEYGAGLRAEHVVSRG